MSEPEELISDAARHATVFARDLWRRHRGPSDVPRTLALADVAPRIDLLVTGVFGEGRRIRIAQPPAPATLLDRVFGRYRGPRARNPVPATDGASLWLPADLGLEDDTLAATCYKAMALQQAVRARRGSAALPRKNWPALVADVYLLLEARAADEALVSLLPGFASSIHGLRSAALERRPALASFPEPRRSLEEFMRRVCERGDAVASAARGTPEQSLAAAREIVNRIAPTSRDARAFGTQPLLKDWWTGELRAPLPSSEPTAGVEDATGGDGEDDALPRTGRLRRSPKVRDAAEDEDDGEDDQGVWMVQVDDPHPHAEDPMGLKRPADRDEETSADEFGDMVSDLPEARTVSTPGSPKEVLMSEDPPDARAKREFESAGDAAKKIRYPEWDYRARAYRRPGAAVRSSLAEPGAQAWVDATLAEHGAMLHAVRRRFEMLRAQRTRLRKQFDGDEIDLEACIESAADRRAGKRGHEALYESRRATQRDLAVMLLIDVSGSTDGWVSANRRIIDVEREALLVVCLALQGLGEPYAVEAFSGEGPGGVTLRTVKGFEELYGNTVALRIAGLEPERYTRAGAAIRHATTLLMRRPASQRLLLLLSDGKPNDVDEYEGRYGAEDMRQAVVEAKLQGVFPFCLTIDRQAANYLPRVFGASQYALLPNPERLPAVLVDWMRRLIAE